MAKINTLKPTEQTNREDINSPTKYSAKMRERDAKIASNIQSKGTDIENSLGAALGDMYNGIAKIPRYIYEAAAIPQNFIAEKLNSPEWKTSYDDVLKVTDAGTQSIYGLKSPLSQLDAIGDHYAAEGQKFKDKQVKYDNDILGSLKEGNYGDAGAQIANNIVASMPSMIELAMTDGVGTASKLGTLSKTAINSLPFASSKANEIRDDETIPAYLKPIISGMYGLSEIVPDQAFGSQAIIRKIQSQLMEEGAEAALRTGKDFAQGYIKKALSNIKEPLTDLGKNAVEEMTTQFSQNLIDKVTVDPNKDLMDGIADAGIVGAVQGVGLGTISSVIGKSKESIKKKNEAIRKLSDDIDNPEIPDGAKEVLSNRISALKQEVQKEITDSTKEFEALDDKSKEKYIETGAKIDTIDKALSNESVSEEAKTALQEEKKVLDKELEGIKPESEKSDQQNATNKSVIDEDRTITYDHPSGEKRTLNTSNITMEEGTATDIFDPKRGELAKFVFKEGNNRVGELQVKKNKDGTANIKFSQIYNPSLRKKGLGPIFYGAIAKTLKNEYGLELVSDVNRTPDAEALWSRLEKEGKAEVIGEKGDDTTKYTYRYITDGNSEQKMGKAVLKGNEFTSKTGEKYLIDINNKKDDQVLLSVKNKDNSEKVGSVGFWKNPEGQWYGDLLWVDNNHQRKGIATAMYDFAEANGIEMVPSESQTEDGSSFFASRSKKSKDEAASKLVKPIQREELKVTVDGRDYLVDGQSIVDANTKGLVPLTDENGLGERIINEYEKQANEKSNVPTPETVETDQVEVQGEKVLAKAEDDLKALKQVTQKTAKYEGSIKRLTEAKKQNLISEKEFNDLKNRFDDVIADSVPKTKADVEASLQEPTGETNSKKEEIKTRRESIKESIARKLKEQRGNLSSGFDPSLIKDFIALGVTYVEEGIVNAQDFIKRFREDYKAFGLDDKDITDDEIRREIFDAQNTGEPNISGIKKGLVSDDIISNVNIDKISDKDMQELGKKLVETGEIKPRDIVNEISKGKKRALQPKEVVALIYYKATLDNARRELLSEYNKNLAEGKEVGSTEAKLSKVNDDITNYDVMSVITAQQQSLAFRLRKGLLDKDYNLVTQIEQYKKVNGGEIPADVLEKFKKLDKELKEVKDKLAEAEKKAQEAEETQSIANIIEDVERSSKTRKSVLSPKEQARKAELAKKYRVFNDISRVVTIFAEKDFREYAKLVLKEAKGEFQLFAKEILKTVGIEAKSLVPKLYEEIGGKEKVSADDLVEKPFVRDGELVVPNEYIRSQVEKGITDIESLSEAVKEAVAEDLPDITLREVRDAITKYGKSVNQTSDVITRQINEAKRLGKLYSGLEDLQQKGERAKTIREKTQITTEEKELRRQIDILENGLPRTPEEITADNRKKYLARFIREKQQRLEEKNFAPKKRIAPLFKDDETIRLETEAQKIRDEYDAAHYENEQANRPKLKKFYDAAIGWGTGIQRTLQAGLDASAFLVQGVIAVGSQNPLKTAKAVAESWKFLRSEQYEQEFFAKLKAQPDYQVIKDSGLALNYPNSKLGSTDYQLQGSEINKIWKYMVAYPFRLAGEKYYDAVLKFNPYRATERSFTGAIDTLRVQMFREFTDVLRNNGITYESSPEQYKIAANAVNNLTFRGRLRNLEGIAKELSVVFFAPRKISATLSLTNPYYWGHMMGQSPAVAKRAIFKMASFIALATTITLATKAFREDDDEDENPDVFNPLSPDFMKLRIGNTRLDFFGGLNQNVILFSREMAGKYKTSTSNQVKLLGSNSFVPTRWELMEQFFYNKFAPTMGLAYRGMNQSAGRKVDWDDEATKGFMPIWTQNIKELYKEHPETMATFLTTMAFFGQNMGTYGGADFLEKGRDDKIIEMVQKKGASFNTKTRSSIEVIDKKTLEDRGLTEDEYKEYKEDYGAYIKSELKDRYRELESMSVDKFEKTLMGIKSSAKKYAEEQVSGIKENMLTVEKDNVTYELTPSQVAEREKMNRIYVNNHSARRNTLINKYIRKGMNRAQAVKSADKEILSMANSKSREIIIKKHTKAGRVTLKQKE